MKQIEVVAAIIRDAEGRIFATQRGYGNFKAAGKREKSQTCLSSAEREQARLEGKAGWEFPGEEDIRVTKGIPKEEKEDLYGWKSNFGSR